MAGTIDAKAKSTLRSFIPFFQAEGNCALKKEIMQEMGPKYMGKTF